MPSRPSYVPRGGQSWRDFRRGTQRGMTGAAAFVAGGSVAGLIWSLSDLPWPFAVAAIGGVAGLAVHLRVRSRRRGRK